MFSFLVDEGKNISSVKRMINYCDLKIADLYEFKQQVELIANKCCLECDKIDGQIISVEEALESQPLPNPKCTRQLGCFCTYGIVTTVDENGRLVRK